MKNFLSSFGHRVIMAALAGIFALAFTCAPTQEARAEGFELGAGFGWLGDVTNDADWQGFHFMVTPGYRILDWVGVYLDEGFGGLFFRKDGVKMSMFQGQTVVNAKFFLQLGPGEFWGKVGIGACYLARDREEWEGGGHDSKGAFAFKLGVGYTVDLWGNLGIGGNFDYLLGAYDGHNSHYLDLQIHVRYKF